MTTRPGCASTTDADVGPRHRPSGVDRIAASTRLGDLRGHARPPACPRWRRAAGPGRASRTRPRRGPARDARLVDLDADPGAAAISFSVDASPPRVGSRMHVDRRARGGQHRRDQPVQRARVGRDLGLELERPRARTGWRCRARRSCRTAARRRPGRARCGRQPSPAATDARCPVVVMNTPSPVPRSTTFVSPVTTVTPGARARPRRIDATMRRRSASGRPSSRMNAAGEAQRPAPLIARSLTVPCTASLPMSPPGKNSGRDHERVGA